ncbi:anaerobic ribonucleoside-triphosphate reductase activating protein [Rhabdochromatium marinum]|uniref:anaerobic ribonucleoside-triphosphate reductase activating protein n=1 Tax=Rhabdochromatium marinum TaxID=48729 RepID=UPI0019035221|nr:anaerobic ribonucleoside-triphosphate reductase activating protein [Rhabdochromatium marinum]MBK1647430.1 anaerobic ribonucleoside-triphosphate reductase activating protein [Rhabdochromatium marinum]
MDVAPTSLRLGGLTALSTTDYPGELAATLFCQGCPWRCAYCHNAHLLNANTPPALSWAEVLEFLGSRRGLLDAVLFSGGEPTLQAALPTAIQAVRRLGFKVGLHSGGPAPQRLARVLPLIDWLGLDIKALPEDYPLITGVPGSGAKAWESLALALASDVALEVRTTVMPGFDHPDYLADLMQQLAAAGVSRYALQQCRPHSLLDAELRTQLPTQLPPPDSTPFAHFVLRTA